MMHIVRRADNAWPDQTLRQTLHLLPAGNRVGADWPPQLPRSCQAVGTRNGAKP